MSDKINRRDFMKRAAISTAGASLALSAAGGRRAMAASDRMQVGVIGPGLQETAEKIGTDELNFAPRVSTSFIY